MVLASREGRGPCGGALPRTSPDRACTRPAWLAAQVERLGPDPSYELQAPVLHLACHPQGRLWSGWPSPEEPKRPNWGPSGDGSSSTRSTWTELTRWTWWSSRAPWPVTQATRSPARRHAVPGTQATQSPSPRHTVPVILTIQFVSGAAGTAPCGQVPGPPTDTKGRQETPAAAVAGRTAAPGAPAGPAAAAPCPGIVLTPLFCPALTQLCPGPFPRFTEVLTWPSASLE